MLSLKVSDPSKEGKVSVSKWIKHQVLLDAHEMERLLDHLQPLFLFNVSHIAPLAELEISSSRFLEAYRTYIDMLKNGKTVIDIDRSFSSAMTGAADLMYAHEVGENRYMARWTKPVIQLQHHRFYASKMTHAIHPMVMSGDSIHWGLQFSYPQIFHEESESEFMKVSDREQFPNTSVFAKMGQWLRSESVPATFVWDGQKIASSIRLGKECFSWIQDHAQLKQQQIGVHVY